MSSIAIETSKDTSRMVLKGTLPKSEWAKYEDVIGDIVELEPTPDKYNELMSYAREHWFYNGLNVLETVKADPETHVEKIVWLVLFY
jgi:hypothetical protein